MKKTLLGFLAAALIATGAAFGVPAKQAKSHDCQPTASISVTETKIRISGHCLTPGSYAGIVENFRSNDKTVSRSTRPNIFLGKISTTDDNAYLFEVDETGSLSYSHSRNILTSGASGRIVAVLSTTAGDVTDAVTET